MATNGREVDVATYISKMLRIINHGELDNQENLDFLRKFGAQLIIVSGPDAPEKVLEECATCMSKKSRAFLAELWAPLVSDYREGWRQPRSQRR